MSKGLYQRKWTMLTDKHGTKIHEGDTLRFTQHPGYLLESFEGTVFYDPEFAAFAVYPKQRKTAPIYFAHIDCIREDFLNHVEVIGSIDESESLIK